MKDILVSIITPCFNSNKTIVRTIESVINQTYKNIEYIIIDGGSKDSTLAIIEECKDKYKYEIKVVSEKDKGIYDAINKGISYSNGELIGIINSDDWYELDAVENIVSNYMGHKYCVLYGIVKVWERKLIKSIYFNSHNFIKYSMIAHPTCFVSKNIYTVFGAYNSKYKSSADYEFILRISYEKNVDFIPIYKCITNFSSGGISSGQRGVRETACIKYKYKLISRNHLNFICFKSYVYEKMNRFSKTLES